MCGSPTSDAGARAALASTAGRDTAYPPAALCVTAASRGCVAMRLAGRGQRLVRRQGHANCFTSEQRSAARKRIDPNGCEFQCSNRSQQCRFNNAGVSCAALLMATRSHVLRLYRHLLKGAKDFPSIKRDRLYQDIRQGARVTARRVCEREACLLLIVPVQSFGTTKPWLTATS